MTIVEVQASGVLGIKGAIPKDSYLHHRDDENSNENDRRS